MTELFLTVLNMSLTAGFVIAVLCAARLVLKKIKAPKWISYALWAVAGFRLAVPFTFESVLSLLPFKSAPIPRDIALQATPRIDSGIILVDNAVSGSLPAATPTYSANPLQIWLTAGACLWLAGIAVMLLYAVVSYLRLIRRKDSVATPFVYGFMRPKIHIPLGLTGEDLRYVTLHEQTHINRKDYLIKLFAFALLCVHWFNPLAWVAFVLLCADMEMSCDERVLRELGTGVKADYSQALLSLSANRRILNASPLAFGEGGLKERVKNVLSFKKRSRVIIIAAVALVAVLSAGFAVNRITGENTSNWEPYEFDDGEQDGVFFITDREAYNPNYISISAQLMNTSSERTLTCGNHFTLVKQIDSAWKIVPFSDSVFFTEIAWLLEYGSSNDYTVKPEMLRSKLGEGTYRIVTDVWYGEETREKMTVWAEFRIDKNAELQETHTLSEDWLGNLDGAEMTVEQMKQIAERFIVLNRNLTIKDDLSAYKGVNLSSNSKVYLMDYSVEGGEFRLNAHAGEDGIITRMTIDRLSDGAILEIEPSNYGSIDEFISGATTEVSPAGEPAAAATEKNYIQPAAAIYTLDQPIGAANPTLDYASDKYVIFHDYFGMFVYDLKQRTFIRTLNLEAIGCQYTQGSDACEVVVSADGGNIYLRTMESKKMYVWDLTAEPDKSLYSGDYELDWPDYDECFRSIGIDTVFTNMGWSSYNYGAYSYNAAEFQWADGVYYGYLYFSDGTIGGICYTVEDDMVYLLFSAPDTSETTEPASTTRTHPITGEERVFVVDGPYSSAANAVYAYYSGTVFAGKISALRAFEIDSDYITPDMLGDLTVAFSVEMTDDPKSHPGRIIILTREADGEWKVINEGY